MRLDEHIFRTALWRSHSFPFSALNLVVVCYKKDLEHLRSIINSSNTSLLRGVVILDLGASDTRTVTISSDDSEETYPVIPVTEVNQFVHCEFILFSKDFEYNIFLGGQRFLEGCGIESFYVVMPYAHNYGFRTACIPSYYKTNEKALNDVYSMIADEASRDVFAARVRSILTGNVGYLPISRYSQYMHPVAGPRAGDIVIDGGVSEAVGNQIQIADAVGQSGRICGFEPEAEGFAKAQAALTANGRGANYELVPLGLWDKKEVVCFHRQGMGSHVAEQPDDSGISVEMTSVDAFVKDNALPRVDFIKLDVEGAELRVLQGAAETIRKYQPRLAISAYHKFEDLFILPKIIKKINKNYTLFFGHHHPALYDTVVYAAV